MNKLDNSPQKSLDVIYVLQAGFIGCWGEWYYTTNYGVKKDDYKPNASQKKDRVEIMKALLNAVPGRMVQMRTPALKQVQHHFHRKKLQSILIVFLFLLKRLSMNAVAKTLSRRMPFPRPRCAPGLASTTTASWPAGGIETLSNKATKLLNANG